jgi:hypothetical protein
MEQNPYQSPQPPSEKQEPPEPDTAVRLLAEMRNMLHEMLTIQRKAASLTRFMIIALGLVVGILLFTVAGIALLRIMLPGF